MSDGRKNNGGARPGGGRKPKADEQSLIERLSPMDDLAFEAIMEGVKNKDQAIIKLFMGYRFGQPKQTIDASLTGELNISWFEEKTYEPKE